MSYQYKVVPFTGQASGGTFTPAQAKKVAAQLEEAIQSQVKEGWEYVRVESVTIQVAPGCLAGFLMLHKESYTIADQIVFRKPK